MERIDKVRKTDSKDNEEVLGINAIYYFCVPLVTVTQQQSEENIRKSCVVHNHVIGHKWVTPKKNRILVKTMQLQFYDVIVVFGWVASGPDGVGCEERMI